MRAGWARGRPPGGAVRALDVAAVAGLVALAYHEQAARFRGGQFINLGIGGDWIAHAYRAKLAAVYQLTSWDPAWDRGYPNLDGWQQVPDWLAGVVSSVIHTPAPRAMLLLTMACLVAYPVAGYVSLRLMRCGPLAALLGAALLLDSPALFTVTADYAGLFGLVALPVAVWVILNHFGRRGGWAGAVLVGLLVELHPFAAVAAASLVVARLIYDRGHEARRVVAQCAVAFAVAAPYWLTLLTYAQPRASDSGVEASKLFADSHFDFHLGVAELSIAAVVLVVGVVVATAVRRLPHARQAACCLGAAAMMAGALLLSYLGWMPKVVMEAQLTRCMPFAFVLVAMGVAPLGDLVPVVVARVLRLRGVTAVAVSAAVVVICSALMIADGGRFTLKDSAPVTAQSNPSGADIAAWLAAHPELPRPAVFWGDPDVVAASSYDAFGQVEFTGDYTARGWSVANLEVNLLLSAHASYQEVEPFLRAEGVAYLYIADGRTQAATVDTRLAAGSVTLLDRGTAGRIVGVPSPSPAAFSAPAAGVRAANVPDLAFYTQSTAGRSFSGYMQRWTAVSASPQAEAASTAVQSPSVRRISVSGHRGDILVVGQRWDPAWTASVDGRPLAVERVGPDLLGVDLDAGGPQTIVVVHHPSAGERASVGLLAAGLLAALAATIIEWRRPRPRLLADSQEGVRNA
jgi:hypothetical protein